MNQECIDKIIDDLLKKKPSGPAGCGTIQYHSRSEYDYNSRRHVVSMVPSIENFGYSYEALFMLGLHTRDSVDEYVRKRWFENKGNWALGRQRSTVTRRRNRLWGRIQPAVQKLKDGGGKGIYKVRGRLPKVGYNTGGYIFANNLEEAQALIMTFFPQLDGDASDRWRLTFMELGDVSKLSVYNNQLVKKCNEKVKSLTNEIEDIKNKIVAFENHVSMLQVLCGHQLAVETQ